MAHRSSAAETLSQTTSESSTSLSSSMEITVEKYQRLATEYAKIRAQFLVLKKAVIDEEGKNVEQQQTIKIRDQNIRRLEQEIESLRFRNQQLTKRVGVLQSDLDSKDRQNSPGSRRTGFLSFSSSSSSTSSSASKDGQCKDLRRASTSSSNSVNNNSQQQQPESMNLVDELNLELKTKTEELERLKQLNCHLEQQRLQSTERLEHELKVTKNLAAEQTETTERQLEECKSSLRKMEQEKIDLKSRYQKIDQKFHESRVEIEDLKYENKNLKQRIANLEHLIKKSEQESSNIKVIDNNYRYDLNQLSPQQQRQQPQQQRQNKFYKDLSKRQDVIEQFTMKLCEFICALSTVHSNVSQKISIMFALFQKQSNHLYFLDFQSSLSSIELLELPSSMNDCSIIDTNRPPSTTRTKTSPEFVHQSSTINNDPVPFRSMSVMSILRKFRDYMQMGYDTYLVQLEDASKQYSELKIQQWKQQSSPDSTTITDSNAIEQEISKTSIDIVETFADYVGYLNKTNIYLTICLNLWCKQYVDYDPSNHIIQTMLDPQLQAHLADPEKRRNLCEKNEMLIQSITNCVTIIGQICNYVQLLLSKSLMNTNFLTIFNEFMHRIDALEHGIGEAKRVFSSKVVLEHDLGVTIESELKSADDCILSSVVFLSKCVQEIRLIFEMHYFFFVNDYHPQQQQQQSSNGNVGDSDLIIDHTEDSDDYNDQDTQQQQQKSIDLSNDNKNIETKLKFCQTRLLEVEKEKEHWSIESQLMKVKLEREQKRSNELEQKYQMLITQQQQQQQSISTTTIHNSNSFSGGHSLTNQSIMKNSLNKQQANSNNASLVSLSSRSLDQTTTATTTTMAKNHVNYYAELGSIGSSSNHEDCSSQLIDDDIVMIDGGGNNIIESMLTINPNQSQQQQIKNINQLNLNYMQTKLTRLTDALERIDSRARSYENDCQSLRQRLLIEQDHNCQLRQESEHQESRMNRLQEELKTTVNNYEQQLQAMSEHMAKLNETLAKQCEQIDVLEYEKSNSDHHHSNIDSNQKKSSTTVSMTC